MDIKSTFQWNEASNLGWLNVIGMRASAGWQIKEEEKRILVIGCEGVRVSRRISGL